MKFQDVPLPIWMQKLPRDKRGYPIPVSALIDDNGKPHFTIVDEEKRQQVIRDDCCAICGRKLLKRRALVGGPGCAFLEGGAYLDPPMHVECARYAVQVCPYLAVPNYSKRLEGKTLDLSKVSDDLILTSDENMILERPNLFVLVILTKHRKIMGNGNLVKYIKPLMPYVEVEYWKSGVKLDSEEGQSLAKERLVELMSQD